VACDFYYPDDITIVVVAIIVHNIVQIVDKGTKICVYILRRIYNKVSEEQHYL